MLANASPLELAWTVTSALGLLAAAALLALSARDEYRRRRLRVDGMVRLDVWKSILMATTLVAILVPFAVAGLVSMQIPPRPDVEVNTGAALSAFLVPVLFIMANLAATVCAIGLMLMREALNQEITDAAAAAAASDPASGPTTPAPPVPP